MKTKKIIHVDMDAFYASVEQRDNPELRGKPIIVGGSPNSRGVVATASYEARRFGVHSAMPSSHAYRLCPQAIFVKPNFEAYKQVSAQIRDIFRSYTNLVEPLSLDEAYLDVTKNKREIESATYIAEEIRKRIYLTTGLTASAGVSYNKFLAKVASDYKKPNGITVIIPARATMFIDQLPIGKFFGIGEKTEAKMKKLGIHTGYDLRKWDIASLARYFGKMGVYFYYIARGIDNRIVSPNRIRKSIGAEHTFPVDINNYDEILSHLQEIAVEVEHRMVKSNTRGKTITLKVRYANFQRITRSRSIRTAMNNSKKLYEITSELLAHTDVGNRAVRLLGIQVSMLDGKRQKNKKPMQLELPFAV